MKAISLLQPWASLIAIGHKRVETRSWRTHYRGPILIHASKGFPSHCQTFAAQERQVGRLTGKLPLGAVVAKAMLFDCIPTEQAVREITPVERHLGDYSANRWAWFMDHVEPLPEPITWKGCLYLWEVPAELLAQVDAQLAKGVVGGQ